MKRGSGCSFSGKHYELQIYNIVKRCYLNGRPFNVQRECDLGGCGAKNDIECLMGNVSVAIEIKRKNTPDWMQCSLNYDGDKWVGSPRQKIPQKSKELFEQLLCDATLFHHKIPPFMLKDVTHEEWLSVKIETTDFNDMYLDCPDDTIQTLYAHKKCSYIQISDKGLYHLGDDLCKFKVPEFKIDQQLRIRTKIHKTKNAKGFCKLSVTVSCQPKHIQDLMKSPYSLDGVLPVNLIYANR
jgi:hypothetical protein